MNSVGICYLFYHGPNTLVCKCKRILVTSQNTGVSLQSFKNMNVSENIEISSLCKDFIVAFSFLPIKCILIDI